MSFQMALTITTGLLDEVGNILIYLKVEIFNTLRDIWKRLILN